MGNYKMISVSAPDYSWAKTKTDKKTFIHFKVPVSQMCVFAASSFNNFKFKFKLLDSTNEDSSEKCTGAD